MTCFLICMFTLLMICLMLSKAMLSPPKHLTVGLLDFKATAEWLPGQGNPPGSRFTLEFIPAQNMPLGKWIGSPNCTNTDVLKCELTLDQQAYDLHWNYFVRVKTTFKGTSSKWTTTPKSFQPYGDTRLSSPDVNISTDQKSITISFSHWLELNEGTALEYLLYLFENSPVEETKLTQISASKSPHIFKDMPSGKNYCVSVSASHLRASNNNFNTTKCIFLPDSTRSFVLLVCILAMLLITISTVIVLTLVCSHHLRPKIKNLHIPTPLINISVTNWVLKLMPDEINTLIWLKPVANTSDWASASDLDSKDGPSFYHQRENLTNAVINSSSTANVNPQEQTNEDKTSDQYYKYTLATDMEEQDGGVLSQTGDDRMLSGSFEILSACSSNDVRLPEILPTVSVNMLLNRYCAEETVSCSSDSDCERETPSEEDEDEEEDIFLLLDSSQSGYEPR